MRGWLLSVVGLASWSTIGRTLELDVKNEASVKNAAATAAYGLMKYYTGNNTGDVPGNLPSPYYWWIAGAMFGTMIDYWRLTGDSSYAAPALQDMVHQADEKRDFKPPNQTLSLGNDDQSFWGMRP